MSAPRERRPLTLFDLSCIGVNAIVGSSIFLIPGKLAAALGPASILAFAATGLLLLPVALCFAEAGGRFDGHGGPYLYAREAFGRTGGFAIGWLCWLTEIVSWAAVADGIAPYLGLPVKPTALAVIAALAALNARGVKPGARAADAFTLAKLVPLAALVLAGLPHVSARALSPFAPHGLKPLGPACLMAYFAFQGFEVVPVPAGEVARPRRDVPLAVLLSLAVSGALYILVQAVATAVEPGLAGSQRPLALVAARLLGPAGAALISAGAAVSMIGFNAGCALGGPRYAVALGEHGDLPGWLARRHAAYGSPVAAIALTAALAAGCALALDFERLVDVADVVIGAQYASTCLAVLVIRRRLGASPGFRAPGGALLPLAGAGAAVWLSSQVGARDVAGCGALLAAGFALRALSRRAARHESFTTADASFR